MANKRSYYARKSGLALISAFMAILLCVASAVFAVDLSSFEITDQTNPEIAALYQQYQSTQEEIDGIERERVDALTENATAMHDKEQSLENRTLTSLTSAATGIGAMELAQGLAEQTADSNADSDMDAYIATMRCSYGDGKSVKAGLESIELPAGDGETMTALKAEYMSLAQSLKERKESLGMVPGIESETILDKADLGLYDDENIGITGGSYASLYRASMLNSEEDQTKIDEDASTSENRVKYGATAAGLGVLGGIIGNAIINKDAPTEQSDKINSEYDSKVATAIAEQKKIEEKLETVIAKNAAAVDEYNRKLREHQDFVATIGTASLDCQSLLSDYIDMISKLSPIENETDTVPDVTFPDIAQYKTLLQQCTDCDAKGGIFDSATGGCECPPEKPKIINGVCAPEPVVEKTKGIVEQPEVEDENKVEPVDDGVVAIEEKHEPDPDQCPATGNALKSITDAHKAGDSCTSSIISSGTVKKRANGTCTCVADGCFLPYVPVNGRCEKQADSSGGGAGAGGSEYADANGNCKPYTFEYTFVKANYKSKGGIKNADISEYFNNQCNSHAKSHNCTRTDLNTSKKTFEDNDFLTYEWICNASSDDYLAAEERINKRYEALTYTNVCTEKNVEVNKAVTVKEGNKTITKVCSDYFESFGAIPDYKTQSLLAKELFKQKTGSASFVCSEDRDINTYTNITGKRTDGYYLKCNTTDDLTRYTFKFSGGLWGTKTSRDPTNADVGAVANSTAPATFMNATCSVYGVKYGQSSVARDMYKPYCNYQHKGKDDPKCKNIDAFVQKLGYRASIVAGLGCVLDTSGGLSNNNNGMLSSDTMDESKLRTFYDLDNYMFANISTNMDEWLFNQMRSIVSEEMVRAGHRDALVKFECFPTKAFVMNGKPVLTCQANGHDIDFVFQQLGSVTQRKAKAAQEGLTCILGSKGKYDGRKCWGLTKEQCIGNEDGSIGGLNAYIKHQLEESGVNCPSCGAEWSTTPEPGVCVLTKSTRVEKNDTRWEIAGNAAVLVGATVLTIFSEGATTPVVVATAIEFTGLVTEAYTSNRMRTQADLFLAETQFCKDAECAEKLLDSEKVLRILNLEANLTEKQSITIDSELARLIDLLPPGNKIATAIIELTADKPNCNFWHKLGGNCEWEQMVNAWAQVAQFASLVYSLGRVGWRLIGRARKALIKSAEKTIVKMGDAAGDAGRAGVHGGPKGGVGGGGAGGGARGAGAADDAARGAGGGARGAGAADDAARGASGAAGAASGKTGTGALHPDIQAYKNAGDLKSAKNTLLKKYHPDKVAQFNQPELDKLATDISQRIQKLDKLNEAELRELSQMMEQFDNSVGAAEAAARSAQGAGKAANSADDAAKTTGRTSGQGARATGATDDAAKTTGKTSGQGTRTAGTATDDATRTGTKATGATDDAARTGKGTADATDDAVRTGTKATGAASGTANQSGKKGRDLLNALHDRAEKTGAHIRRADGFFASDKNATTGFFEIGYRTQKQCATGLKFHVSVDPDDLEKASYIIDDLVKNSDVADVWKVHTSGIAQADPLQQGKSFTIYVSQSGYDQTKIQKFMNSLEDALKKNNVRSEGFGKNILSGDKKVPGSNYINYRYDRIDDAGNLASSYNNSYRFAAPKAENGGDIMNGVGIGKTAPSSTSGATGAGRGAANTGRGTGSASRASGATGTTSTTGATRTSSSAGRGTGSVTSNSDDVLRGTNTTGRGAGTGTKTGTKTTGRVTGKAANSADDALRGTKAGTSAKDAPLTDAAIDDMSLANPGRMRNGTLNSDELARLRKHYPNLSDSELQAKAKDIAKELDAQRMTNGGLTNAERRVIENFNKTENAASDIGGAAGRGAGTGAKTGTETTGAAGRSTGKTTKMTVSQIAKKDTGTIIRESKNLSPAEQTELWSKLSSSQRKSIAKLKVDAGEVTLPFGSTVDDLAKNPDLLSISGSYVPLNEKAVAKAAEISRLEKAGKSTEQATKELRHILSNDLSTDKLITNATQYKEKLIYIIASDSKLSRQAQNFSKLSKAEKEAFMDKVFKELETSFAAGDKNFATNVKIKYIDSWTEVGRDAKLDKLSPGATLHHADGSHTIYILNNSPVKMGYGDELDDAMSLMTHEYGHVMDASYAEKVAIGGSAYKGSDISVRSKEGWEDFAEYLYGPSERSSRAINEVVGSNFTKDLNATLKSGKVTTSSLSDIQKLKIETGLTGDALTESSKATNALGVDYYKYVPQTNRTGSLQSLADNFKELGIDNVAVIKEDGKEVIAIFNNADDYNAAMRKLSSGSSTSKTTGRAAGKAANSADDAVRGASTGAKTGTETAGTASRSGEAGAKTASGTGTQAQPQTSNVSEHAPYFVKNRQILKNARKTAEANAVDYDKLDDVGKEWYKLWDQYAPNNQTFDEFKAMTNGNLDEMKQMVKNWDDLGKGAAYSTYDPEMTKKFRELKIKEKELHDWWNSEWSKRKKKFIENGGTGEFKESDEYKKFIEEYRVKYKEAQKFAPTQWEIGKDFQLKNIEKVVAERQAVFDDVIASNPVFKSKMQSSNWRKLTEQQKTEVIQEIMDEYARRLGSKRPTIEIKEMEKGLYGKAGNGEITLNSRYLTDEKTIKETLIHEYGHVVDEFDPNLGALGEQYAFYGDKIYSNNLKNGYRIALTEQSSFAIEGAKVPVVSPEEIAIGATGATVIGGTTYAIIESKKDE